MEAPSNDNCTLWSSETNWTIVHGSLDASVTFESSDSPIDSENATPTMKSPLILKPPSPDYGPCEIKISFKQKHEVWQVYVRSTARVYEIYYAPALQSSNEYLCTVRCGIAARDQELLHAADAAESAGELSKEKFKHEVNIGTNEDGWVEVKVPYSPLTDNRNSSLPVKIVANTGTCIQDCYEATAEITDADPCISLTFRLLSLQSKGCVYVDEVYVYADPVESADSDNQVVQVGNLAGSSLMATLVPTLLQISKSGISQVQNKHTSDTMEKQEDLEIGSRTTNSTNIANETQQEEKSSIDDQQDVKLLDVNGTTTETPQVQIHTQVLDREEKHDSGATSDFPYGQIERSLELLVSRVSRIEDICSRFEENMLKPICNMEARLQRVEQQLEVLSKNSQYSVFPSGTRISAPSFSCSESSSFYNDGSDYPACGALELEKKVFSSGKLPNPPDDMSISVNASQFLPSLVVTAPEFSCRDGEENNDASEPSKDSPQEKPKQALSIDDALAAAFAGFLSVTTVQSSNYTRTFTVKAPEFTTEENGSDDEIASPSIQNEQPIVPSVSSCESNGMECIKDSVSTSSNSASVEGDGQVMRNLNDGHLKEMPKGVDGQEQSCEKVTGCSFLGATVDCTPTQAIHDLARTDDCQITEETNGRESTNKISDALVSEENDILEQFLGNQTQDNSDALRNGRESSNKISDALVSEENDILEQFLGNQTEDNSDALHNGRESSNKISDALVSEENDILKQFPGNQTEHSSDALHNGAAASTEDIAEEGSDKGIAEEGSDKGILQSASKSSCASLVDFEIPILDVKFASWENSSTKSPLEALLTDMPEFNVQAPCVQESDDDDVEQSNPIPVEDGEPVGALTLTNNHLLVDLGICDLRDVSSTLEGEDSQDPYTCRKQEMFASLI